MGRHKILIIDDDEDVLCACQTMLSRHGYDVACAHTGEVGFAAALQLKPDLILLDVIMSPEDGLDIAARLKDDPRTARIPIVMMSAVAEKLHKQVYSPEIADRFRADRFLQKPFDPDVLLTEVRGLLDTRISTGEPSANQGV